MHLAIIIPLALMIFLCWRVPHGDAQPAEWLKDVRREVGATGASL
jgi:hypothetical protein